MQLPRTSHKPGFNITRSSHVVMRVRDLAVSRAFYVDALGLLVTQEDSQTIWLRGLEEACHHSLVLKKGDAPLCERFGFRVFQDEDLDVLSETCHKAGLTPRFVEVPYQSRTLHVTDPVGVPLEFCASMPVQTRAVTSFKQHHGVQPMRLDHCQILTPMPEAATEFYCALGFRISEYIVEEPAERIKATFLQRKGNPHDIVFMRNPGPRIHHFAFTAPEAGHLMHACDVLASHGFGNLVEHGPGRHFGPGYARFLYLRDPDGHRVEFFNNHYQTMDIEDEPLRWQGGPHGSASRWGRGAPQSWNEEATSFASADA